ncbi:L-fuculose-phosphate aldolase OS=Castellaniella defragrans OX=75697 GN=HNR28_002622 PE=3 SV=1 [Castellaniella defragrans]
MATHTQGSAGAGGKLIDSNQYRTAPVQRGEEDERTHRKEQLVAALRIFADLGYTEGVAGHITARDPGDPDTFWVNPYALHFSKVQVSDLVRIDGAGQVLEGRHPVNRAAFAIHHAIHEARPDVISAVHVHTVVGRAWCTLGRALAPLVQESCAFYKNHAVMNDYDGIISKPLQAAAVAQALGQRRAVTLMHHGNITVGTSVEEAAWWFMTLDRCCDIEMRARATGCAVHEMPDEWAALASRQFGNPGKARVSFGMLYDVALDKYPMFD